MYVRVCYPQKSWKEKGKEKGIVCMFMLLLASYLIDKLLYCVLLTHRRKAFAGEKHTYNTSS